MADQNRCGEFKAAEPVADTIAVGGFDGPAFMTELREVLARHPRADRFVYLGKAPVTALPDEIEKAGVMAVRGLRPTDTCKEVTDGVAIRTVPRERLIELTGPWACSRETIELAVDRVAHEATRITSLLELCRASRIRLRVFAS